MAKILIVDDEEHVRGSIKMLLEFEGYQILTASNGQEALDLLQQEDFDLVISDVRMPKMTGLDLLHHIKKMNPLLPVMMITAHATVDDVIEAMREGAFNYLKKPYENDEVVLLVKKALEMNRLQRQIAYLRDEIDQTHPFKNFIGHSPAIKSVFELIRRVAPTFSTVLITGESGTGKELVARAIHDNSPRRDKPMIKVNCVAIPDTLLESELFGHVKGAFTDATYTKPGKFELAEGGTLFLDEIGDMSLSLQGKILRVLQEKEFEPVGGTHVKKADVRIIAATNRPLKKLVKEGTFRSDLYFRLNVVPINIPPLRERPEDIPDLIQHFINKYSQECGKAINRIKPDAITFLQQYDYPGNVRELENLIERAVVLCLNNELGLNDFNYTMPSNNNSSSDKDQFYNIPYRDAKRLLLESFEKQYFSNLLSTTHGNISQAAQMADMDRNNFKDKLQSYNIDPHDFIQTE